MMETFLEDAEYSLHHRNNAAQDGSECSGSSDESDDPFLYDKFLPDPDWSLKNRLEEEETKSKNTVDPGPFRYNKRILVSCLPGVLVLFVLGGESLVFLIAVATAVITTVTQLGDSKRCVVIFVLFFIPTHVYILSTAIPLLWLSGWHIFSVIAINMFVILTAGWVIIQFKAFRTEESGFAALIELALFTLYPLLSTGLFCWSLAAVITPSLIPIIFSFMWFVQLQIYLIPTLSSFRSHKSSDGGGSGAVGATGVVEENLDVLQVPMVILTVVAFVWSGPLLSTFVTALSPSLVFFSWMTLVHLIFMLSLTLFLLSLLSIRQIFEYTDLPYSLLITVRWLGGFVCTLLCYPVLHNYGLDSHFLPFLPVAIAMFAALGFVLSMKKRKVIVTVLTMMLVFSLIILFLDWIQRMPHNLRQYFLGYLSLNSLYLVIGVNLLLCLLCLGMISVDATSAFGSTVCLQAVVLTMCEVSLHNSSLYSTSLIQLSSILALYAVHRLQVAEKMARGPAILSSSIYLAKSVASTSSLVLDKTRGEITILEMCVLVVLTYAFLSVFMYGTPGTKSGMEVFQQLTLLLCGLAVSGHHLLLPVSMVLFQGSHSYSYVLGLWCVVGATLTLLYSQTVATEVKVQVLKAALTLAVLGSVVILLHPQLALTFYSLFQWLEMINCVILVGVFSSQLSLSPQHSVIMFLPLAVCPAIRTCFILWSHLWMPQVVMTTLTITAIFILAFVCLLVPELTEDAEKVIKYSILVAVISSVSLLGVDLMSWHSLSRISILPISVWDCPSWKALVITGLPIVVILKIVQTIKGPDKLPMTLTAEVKPSRWTLPVMSNVITLVTFVVACTQGPQDPFLHDLWCCTSAITLGCLHSDDVFFSGMSGERQAAPIVVSSVVYLVVFSFLRSRFWQFSSILTSMGGFLEISLLVMTSPIYFALWSILWKSEVWSEPSVVFLTPWNTMFFFVGTNYTSWLTGVSGLLVGTWMMMTRLPMIPYAYSSYTSATHTS